ncbi:MAG: hypothetical protein HY834_13595 [Devosia nanyangense]|uniref:ATP-grasp domain-containing protein n=1 Tax=Devosia nanyangense TaxID=1228055 RepID=A0A933NYY4_9HYPH|nr:hypothetical protein [Devosia nanyangense]
MAGRGNRVAGGDPSLRALVFGHSFELMEPVPALLSRAGFEVCLMTTSPRLARCRHVARFVLVPRRDALVDAANREAADGYQLVVAGDDTALKQVLRSSLTPAEKLRLLPVSSDDGFGHLASKIGLSRTLSGAGVATPPFAVAASPAELGAAAAGIGYPLFLKSDFGGGGQGVRGCASEADLQSLADGMAYPLLVQKKLAGPLVDCSAFFRNGDLVTFSYSTIVEAKRGGLGPSVLRRYRPGAARDTNLIAQVRQLGRSLAANGFSSVSAIESEVDGRLSFFEADMRPTVWVEYPKYFGQDPATAIAAAFSTPASSAGDGAVPGDAEVPDAVVLPYLPRMSLWDIARNRYRCWSYYENYAGRSFAFDRVLDSSAMSTIRRLNAFFRRRWAVPRALFQRVGRKLRRRRRAGHKDTPMIRFRSPLNLALLVLGALTTIAGYLLIAPGVDLPVRWGLDLQPTATLTRNLALLQMPVAVAVIWAIFVAVRRFGNTERQPARIGTLNWTLTGVTALLVAVQLAIVVIGLSIGRAA